MDIDMADAALSTPPTATLSVAPASTGAVLYPVSPAADVLAAIAYQYGSSLVMNTASDTLCGLLRHRDFLLAQLDHAWGNIGTPEYDAIAAEYFKGQEQSAPSDLPHRIFILQCIAPGAFTPDALSEALGLKLKDVEIAFEEAAKMLAPADED